MVVNNRKFDFFIFGSNSEVIQKLIRDYKAWFLGNVNQLYVSQRSQDYSEIYEDFKPISLPLDCANIQEFRNGLTAVVQQYGTTLRPMHVFTTYGKFTWNFAKKHPVFSFSDDGWQINLTARLQIIDAFRPYRQNTKFHLFGSLYANFPYTGDYAVSMWYVNQLPRNSEYQDLDLNIYNLGGMKTRFWDYKSGPNPNPFLHKQIPTHKIFKAGFVNSKKGIFTFYPSSIARFACFLGSKGMRLL